MILQIFSFLCVVVSFPDGVSSEGLSIHPAHVHVKLPVTPTDSVMIVCAASHSITTCQFKVDNQPYVTLRAVDSSTTPAGLRYLGRGLEFGDCGVQLATLQLFRLDGTYREIGCRVRNEDGDWLAKSISVYSSHKPGIPLTTASREVVAVRGGDARISFQTSLPLTTCSFQHPGENLWLELREGGPPCDTGGYCYYGRGVDKGECGVTIRNVDDSYDGKIWFKVQNRRGIEVDFIQLVVTNGSSTSPAMIMSTPSTSFDSNYGGATIDPNTRNEHQETTSGRGPAAYIALVLAIVYLVILCVADFIKFAVKHKRWRHKIPQFLVRGGYKNDLDDSIDNSVTLPAALASKNDKTVGSKMAASRTKQPSGNRQKYRVSTIDVKTPTKRADRILGHPEGTPQNSLNRLARRAPVPMPRVLDMADSTSTRASMTSFGAPAYSPIDRHHDPRKVPIHLNSPVHTLRKPRAPPARTAPASASRDMPGRPTMDDNQEGAVEFHMAVDDRPLVASMNANVLPLEGGDFGVYYGNVCVEDDNGYPVYGNIGSVDDNNYPIYGNTSTIDDSDLPIYGNTSTMDDDYPPIYGNTSTVDDNDYPIYGNASSIDDNDCPTYDNLF